MAVESSFFFVYRLDHRNLTCADPLSFLNEEWMARKGNKYVCRMQCEQIVDYNTTALASFLD